MAPAARRALLRAERERIERDQYAAVCRLDEIRAELAELDEASWVCECGRLLAPGDSCVCGRAA